MPTSLKHVPSIGFMPVAQATPSRNCNAVTADERTHCYLAPHSPLVVHSGYDWHTDTTVTWR